MGRREITGKVENKHADFKNKFVVPGFIHCQEGLR